MSQPSALPTKAFTYLCAALYVFSGVCQPLVMALCKEAGLADPTAQLYMFFYYLGPATVSLTLCRRSSGGRKEAATPGSGDGNGNGNGNFPWAAALASSLIALFDIAAASMNYTAAGLAGPTVFAIIYSSVTVWTAVLSRIFLKRRMSPAQWVAVFAVFAGLCVTAIGSARLGPAVGRGAALVAVGSMMHGGTYVMNEAIMTSGVVRQQHLTVRQNTAVQGLTAAVAVGVWQLAYTAPRWDELIAEPARSAGTTLLAAAAILVAFMVSNLVHSVTYYHTLRYFAGGATAAGVMKGLQAVLVFVAAHALYCGRIGGREMCFTLAKLVSLVTVSGGVAAFGYLTEKQHEQQPQHMPPSRRKQGYTTIPAGSDDDLGGVDESAALVEVESIHV